MEGIDESKLPYNVDELIDICQKVYDRRNDKYSVFSSFYKANTSLDDTKFWYKYFKENDQIDEVIIFNNGMNPDILNFFKNESKVKILNDGSDKGVGTVYTTCIQNCKNKNIVYVESDCYIQEGNIVSTALSFSGNGYPSFIICSYFCQEWVNFFKNLVQTFGNSLPEYKGEFFNFTEFFKTFNGICDSNYKFIPIDLDFEVLCKLFYLPPHKYISTGKFNKFIKSLPKDCYGFKYRHQLDYKYKLPSNLDKYRIDISNWDRFGEKFLFLEDILKNTNFNLNLSEVSKEVNSRILLNELKEKLRKQENTVEFVKDQIKGKLLKQIRIFEIEGKKDLVIEDIDFLQKKRRVYLKEKTNE